MPIEIAWDDAEHSILRYDVTGKWSFEELYRARDEVFAHMDGVPHERVYAIIHFIGGVSVPSGALNAAQQVRDEPHTKAGVTVVVGANLFLRTALATFTKVYHAATGHAIEFLYAKSLDEARAMIAQERMRS
jgi:hypothetical protein